MSCCLSQTEILNLSCHGYVAEHKEGSGFLGCGSWAGKTFLCKPNASKLQLKWFQTNKSPKVAVKIVNLTNLTPKEQTSFTEVHSLINSINNSDNLVKIIEMFICGENVYLVKEIAKQGNLDDIINSLYTVTRSGLDEIHSKFIFRQIVEGIIYLHDNCIVHRNLSLKCVYGFGNERVKIGGFQFLRKIEECSFGRSNRRDIENLGFIFLHLLSGKEQRKLETTVLFDKLSFTKSTTDLLQDLIGLNISNASEILKYFSGNNKKKPNLMETRTQKSRIELMTSCKSLFSPTELNSKLKILTNKTSGFRLIRGEVSNADLPQNQLPESFRKASDSSTIDFQPQLERLMTSTHRKEQQMIDVTGSSTKFFRMTSSIVTSSSLTAENDKIENSMFLRHQFDGDGNVMAVKEASMTSLKLEIDDVITRLKSKPHIQDLSLLRHSMDENSIKHVRTSLPLYPRFPVTSLRTYSSDDVTNGVTQKILHSSPRIYQMKKSEVVPIEIEREEQRIDSKDRKMMLEAAESSVNDQDVYDDVIDNDIESEDQVSISLNFSFSSTSGEESNSEVDEKIQKKKANRFKRLKKISTFKRIFNLFKKNKTT